MLKAAIAQTFNYPTFNNFQKSSGSQDSSNELLAEFSKYQNTMGIIAEINADDKYDEIKIYDAFNNLRGISKIEDIKGRKLAFINVFSDINEVLKYTLVEGANETHISETFNFKTDTVLGSLKEPINLSQKALSIDNVIFKDVTLYPNPFSNELHINTGNNNNITKAILYNYLGVKVLEKSIRSVDTKMNTTKISKGVYLLKLIGNNGAFVFKKMIKTE